MRHSLLALCGSLAISSAAADQLQCGNKSIALQDSRIISITHEDGSTHKGAGVADYWQYNGKAIKHKLDTKWLTCGSKPKSSDELAAETAAKFANNPKLHGLTVQDGKLMTRYAKQLLAHDSDCKYIVDGAKSSVRKDMYYIDCRNVRGDSERRWITSTELRSGQLTGSNTVSNNAAVELCHVQLRAKLSNPASYDPNTLGITSREIHEIGRNVVTIEFSAKNSLGQLAKYRGECLLERGRALETTVKQR